MKSPTSSPQELIPNKRVKPAAPGASTVVILPSSLTKPWKAPAGSVQKPTRLPSLLMPWIVVLIASGTSMVVAQDFK